MQTSGGKAHLAVCPEAAHAALPPLPLPCFLDVLSRLAPGERLLSSAVSRAWRAAVCEPSLWVSVDLMQEGAFPHVASDALLEAVVRKAPGKITSLSLCLCGDELTSDAALAAVAANTGALRRLDIWTTPLQLGGDEDGSLGLPKHEIDEILNAAGLISFNADVHCEFARARTLLACQGQYSVVHIRRFFVDQCSPEEAIQLASELHLQPSLRELGLWETPLNTPAALGAVVDAAAACGLTSLYLWYCHLGPPSAARLTRMLRDAPRLSTLLICGDGGLFDAASAALWAATLRASSLNILRLEVVRLWEHEGVGNVVVDAIVGHPTIQEISLDNNSIHFDDPRNTVGACLAQLVSTNSPRLHSLSLAYCGAGGDATRPIFEALASNTYLRTLILQHDLAAPFALDVVLPSVRANSTLRKLLVAEGEQIPELVEAEALVAARR